MPTRGEIGRRRSPRQTRLWTAGRYVLAVLTTALATGLEVVVLPRPSSVPFAFFYAAVALTAWKGGFGPSVLAVVLASLSANRYVLFPFGDWALGANELVDTLLFAGASLVVALVVGRLCSASRHLAARYDELRRTEAELRHMAELLEFGDAFFELDAQFRVLRVNANLERMSGLSRAHMLGRELREIWPEVDRPESAFLREYQRCMMERVPVQFEDRFVPFEMWAEVTAYPTAAGGIAVFVRDTTERKRSDQERETLVQALRDYDRRKNEFLAVLSHELRNPLAPIQNSLYVLEHATPDSTQAAHACEVIGRQIAQMSHLIDELLDVTRISRGKIRLRLEQVELCDLVGRVAEDHRSVFLRNGIGLEVVTCPGSLYTTADATRLSQVIGNLLANAVKFTRRGGRVALSMHRAPHGVTIRVRDDGAGIAPEVLPTLFEPFVQAEETLDRSRGGLGLGLALVKGLVDLHGGRVYAKSEGVGKGAEFAIELPLDAQDQAATSGPPSPEPAAAEIARRILVIEDNADAADTLKEVLELTGHEVEIARGGHEGIEKAHAFRPEVVLCDIGLPEIDGYEVARRMKADPGLFAVPLVALSGYAQPEDVNRSLEAGFARHLAKPPDFALLERTLAELAR